MKILKFHFWPEKLAITGLEYTKKMRNSNIWGGGGMFSKKSSIGLYFPEKIMILDFSDYNGVPL